MRPRPDFDGYVKVRSPHLLRLGYLLTHDWHTAEDLVQTALIKAWSSWDRLDGGDPDGYVRKIIVNTHLSWRRRRWLGETPTRDLPEHAAALDPMSAVDEYDRLWRVLGRLPPRQRAVVVLRYFEDLSQEQIAAVLDISVGGVKSQLSRALAALRAVTELRPTQLRPTELRPTSLTTSQGATDDSRR